MWEGIYATGLVDCKIQDNIIVITHDEDDYANGIEIDTIQLPNGKMQSSVISGNKINGAYCGLYIMTEGTFINNNIINNNISDGNIGIYTIGTGKATGNIIASNNITNNKEYGIKLGGRIGGEEGRNKIYSNNFINNANNAFDSGDNLWYNEKSKKGNYWDDYQDKYPDATNNGKTWDTPYSISDNPNEPDHDNMEDKYPLVNQHTGGEKTKVKSVNILTKFKYSEKIFIQLILTKLLHLLRIYSY
jgi:hypothetical protein